LVWGPPQFPVLPATLDFQRVRSAFNESYWAELLTGEFFLGRVVMERPLRRSGWLHLSVRRWWPLLVPILLFREYTPPF